MVKYLLFIHRIIHGPMVEIRIIFSETEYAEALKAKGTQRWRDILLQAMRALMGRKESPFIALVIDG